VAAQARASAAEGAARHQQQAQCDAESRRWWRSPAWPSRAAAQAGAAWASRPASRACDARRAGGPARATARRVPGGARSGAASADVGAARADRFPRLTLSGQIGTGSIRAGGEHRHAQTWSIGPLA
jgi:hypothetical protein